MVTMLQADRADPQLISTTAKTNLPKLEDISGVGLRSDNVVPKQHSPAGVDVSNMLVVESTIVGTSIDQMRAEKIIRNEKLSQLAVPVLRKVASLRSMDHNIAMAPSTIRDRRNVTSDNESSIAGVPILELVRKLEDEKVINREDRLALTRALNDPDRHDFVILSLEDIELSSNLRFAVRRLKMLIHQNSAGLPTPSASSSSSSSTSLHTTSSTAASTAASDTILDLSIPNTTSNTGGFNSPENVRLMLSGSVDSPHGAHLVTQMEQHSHGKQQQLQPFSPQLNSPQSISPQLDDSPSKSSCSKNTVNSKKRRNSYDGHIDGLSIGEHSPRIAADALETISTLVGEAPVYFEPNCYGICSKISRRLHEFTLADAVHPSKIRHRKYAVLVGSGSCNPLTRMHMRSFFLAKQYLESQVGYVVLGSIVSPSHGVTVRERYRNHPLEIIPSPHRLAVAQLMVQGSKWLSVDPWEITRRRAMDYMSLLQHCRETLTEGFPSIEIKIVYICKENMVPKISPQAMRQENFGCISVCRPLECDRIKNSLTSKWNGIIWVAEDTAILDTSMDIVTSREVRHKVRAHKCVKHLVGDLIDNYFKQHRIGAKMNGDCEWDQKEIHLPVIASRPAPPILKNAQNAFLHTELVKSIRDLLIISETSSSSPYGNKHNNSNYISPRSEKERDKDVVKDREKDKGGDNVRDKEREKERDKDRDRDKDTRRFSGIDNSIVFHIPTDNTQNDTELIINKKVKENEKEKDREKDKEKEDGKTFIGPLKVSKSMREIRTKFSPKLQLRKLL